MVTPIIKKQQTVQTTVKLPLDLVERSQKIVAAGTLPDRNALITAALEHFLLELEQQEIDAQFAKMNDDQDYLALNEQLDKAFEDSDWEALLAGEAELS